MIDTNTLISGLFGAASPPAQILDALVNGQFTLVTSPYLTAELLHVLTYPRIVKRLNMSDDEVTALVVALLQRAELVVGELQLPGATRDAKDDAVAACAVEGAVDCLVSGDRDLLDLGQISAIPILTPRQFVEFLAAYREATD